jgi:hypothetical protein
VADRNGDTPRIPESSPPSDALNHLNEQSLEFLSRPTLRTTQDVVETASQLRVLRGHLRDVSKVLRGDVRGNR